MPTAQFERDTAVLRLKAQDEYDVDGTPLGAAAVGLEDVQIDARSGRTVTEVEWATLLDGSRVLELLYRLEVECFCLDVVLILKHNFYNVC